MGLSRVVWSTLVPASLLPSVSILESQDARGALAARSQPHSVVAVHPCHLRPPGDQPGAGRARFYECELLSAAPVYSDRCHRLSYILKGRGPRAGTFDHNFSR